MRKAFYLLILTALLCCLGGFTAFAEDGLSISAKSAVVMCADTLEVVYSKNSDQKLPMASTTKIMSTVLALEHGASDSMFTVTEDMVKVEGTSMGLMAGDSVSLKTLVKGMLLESGNDAANAAAIAVAGSIESFVSLMNEKAAQIGMKSTSFETPSGLDGENHYSTAYDMALLACYALKKPEFKAICSAEKMAVYYGSPPYRRILTNHNKLLNMLEGTYGVKTGFTKKSGRCLVSAVSRDGKNLVAVTLNAPDDWNDHIKLYDYCFERVYAVSLYEDTDDLKLPVVGGKASFTNVEPNSIPSITSTIPDAVYTDKIYLEKFLYAPVKKGDIVGYIEFFSKDGRLLGRSELCAVDTVEVSEIKKTEEKSRFKGFLDKIKDFFR